ncbi:MAG: sugar nucleotide-binding protein [Planctomycetaceae bacterium]
MRILILGANGQLGTACSHKLIQHELIQWTRFDLDLVKLPDIEPKLATVKPDLIINCAAYNLVDKAEQEPGMAYVVNALGPRRVAFYCQTHSIPFVHVSTDYVFGMDQHRSTPFQEDDLPGPLPPMEPANWRENISFAMNATSILSFEPAVSSVRREWKGRGTLSRQCWNWLRIKKHSRSLTINSVLRHMLFTWQKPSAS